MALETGVISGEDASSTEAEVGDVDERGVPRLIPRDASIRGSLGFADAAVVETTLDDAAGPPNPNPKSRLAAMSGICPLLAVTDDIGRPEDNGKILAEEALPAAAVDAPAFPKPKPMSKLATRSGLGVVVIAVDVVGEFEDPILAGDRALMVRAADDAELEELRVDAKLPKPRLRLTASSGFGKLLCGFPGDEMGTCGDDGDDEILDETVRAGPITEVPPPGFENAPEPPSTSPKSKLAERGGGVAVAVGTVGAVVADRVGAEAEEEELIGEELPAANPIPSCPLTAKRGVLSAATADAACELAAEAMVNEAELEPTPSKLRLTLRSTGGVFEGEEATEEAEFEAREDDLGIVTVVKVIGTEKDAD